MKLPYSASVLSKQVSLRQARMYCLLLAFQTIKSVSNPAVCPPWTPDVMVISLRMALLNHNVSCRLQLSSGGRH